MARLQTPLGRVYGLGSARDGTTEFWAMRVSSVALVPLTLWWVIALVGHAGADYEAYVAWVQSPITSILLIVSLVVLFQHTALGLKTVIEDYVHQEATKLGLLLAVRFAAGLLAVAGVFSVLRIAFRG